MDYDEELEDAPESMPRYVRIYRAETDRGVVPILTTSYSRAVEVLTESGYTIIGRLTNGPEDWVNTRSSGHMMRVRKYA
jgi:hypothetical protein